MTVLSHNPTSNHRGSLLAQGSPVPQLLSVTLSLSASAYWNPINALSRAKAEGLLDAIPELAATAVAALAPVTHAALMGRLQLLGMSMMHGKDEAVITAWLHETVRLLDDLPESLLFAAIDECVKEPGRVFCPTVGEIRAKIAGPLEAAEREAAHLQELALLLAEGVTIPDYQPPAPPAWQAGWEKPEEPKEYCSPEDARRILEEEGLLNTATGKALEKMMVAGTPTAKPKTRADYIAAGKVPPALTPSEPIQA